MDQQLDLVVRLTERDQTSEQRQRDLYAFADCTGWRPSDALVDFPGTEDLSAGHLVAEHGLERSAVISFLKDRATFDDLTHGNRETILGLSYNNLIDWHLFPDRHGLTVVFNRGVPIRSTFVRRSEQRDLWRVESFDAVTGRRKPGNVKALDDALVETVSHWRRALATEVGIDVPNHAYAALFNGIILVRAAEDQRRHQDPLVASTLRDLAETGKLSCRRSIEKAMQQLRIDRRMKLVREIVHELEVFDSVDRRTWSALVGDFYSSRFAPYRYDFSLISKHALSRVYEKYVSVLRAEHSPQLSLFTPLPSEKRETPFGEVYTPQYIARFFARFLQKELTPAEFRSAKVMDPACGSGIFLRSILELQCDPHEVSDLQATTAEAFENISGVDIDPNACFATRLSLSLLHLILAGRLPSDLNVVNEEALEFLAGAPSQQGAYDAVVANPPFVKWDNLKPVMRERVASTLGSEYRGKVDLFAAFLATALKLVRPGGYLLFVLPHSFLLSSSSKEVRRKLAEESVIRVLVDLSEVPVFEGIGAYVVLLVCQKKGGGVTEAATPDTVYARVRDYVGHSLQLVLGRREGETASSEVYEVPTASFTEEPWLILPHRQQRLMDALGRLPALHDYCDIQQGIITGADSVFIQSRGARSPEEKRTWRPLLRDRDITRYSISGDQPMEVFYPFESGERIEDETALRDDYPETYAYLAEHKAALEKRAPVRRGNCRWWEPAWPRRPADVFGRPKIVTPHLSIAPRFGFDVRGEFAVTRSPMIFAKERGDEKTFLMYLAAVLNSSVGFWQVIVTSHKYRSGYAMLEKKTLLGVRIPDPSSLDRGVLGQLLRLVEQRMKKGGDALDHEIDHLVADAYELSEMDRVEIGLTRE